MPKVDPSAAERADQDHLQLLDPTAEEAAAEARLLAELTWALARARCRDIISGNSETARAEAQLDPSGKQATERIVGEVLDRALEDSTSRRWYLTLLAERVEQVPPGYTA